MIVNFSWIEEKRIAGFGVFADLGQGEIDALVRQGVGAVVSLTEDPLSFVGSLMYLHIPVRDMQAPALEDVRRFVQFVKECLERDKAVGVHCRAGLGRTGTMLACYLVSRGMDSTAAVNRIRQLRPGSVETADQVRTVVDFEGFVKASSNGSMKIEV